MYMYVQYSLSLSLSHTHTHTHTHPLTLTHTHTHTTPAHICTHTHTLTHPHSLTHTHTHTTPAHICICTPSFLLSCCRFTATRPPIGGEQKVPCSGLDDSVRCNCVRPDHPCCETTCDRCHTDLLLVVDSQASVSQQYTYASSYPLPS